MSLLNQQRRERLLARVMEARHATARDLALELGVSEATVRRDLKILAGQQQLELVYGGATPARRSDYSFQARERRHAEAKKHIGKLAASLVQDDDHVFLDSGTTCHEMAPFLSHRRRLSVIVNSARLALELNAPGLQVITLGGTYRPHRMDTVGPLAVSTLEQLRGYVAFIGADGLHPEFGLAAADIESAQLYRLAIQNARATVLLADHSKFANPSLYKIVDWHAVAHVITDRRPDAAWMDFFDSSNIPVLYELEENGSGDGQHLLPGQHIPGEQHA